MPWHRPTILLSLGATGQALQLPRIIAGAGAGAQERFVAFLAANICNKHTRCAYARQVLQFLDRCPGASPPRCRARTQPVGVAGPAGGCVLAVRATGPQVLLQLLDSLIRPWVSCTLGCYPSLLLEELPMLVTIDVPDDVAQELKAQSRNLPRAILEGLQGYRSGHLSALQMQKLLGLESCQEIDDFIKRHERPQDSPLENGASPYPLEGTVLHYEDPFGPAAPLEDWEALK